MLLMRQKLYAKCTYIFIDLLWLYWVFIVLYVDIILYLIYQSLNYWKCFYNYFLCYLNWYWKHQLRVFYLNLCLPLQIYQGCQPFRFLIIFGHFSSYLTIKASFGTVLECIIMGKKEYCSNKYESELHDLSRSKGSHRYSKVSNCY